MGKVPTISINKTEGCHVYLSQEAMDCEIVSAKSSEMNILVPHGDDYVSVVGLCRLEEALLTILQDVCLLLWFVQAAATAEMNCIEKNVISLVDAIEVSPL